jgi:hypothetical protein
MTYARRVSVVVGAMSAVLLLAVPQLNSSATGIPPIVRGDTEWWSGVQRGVAAHEYHPRVNHAGLQAVNRAHSLRTYFDGSGIRVHDRTAPAGTELVGLSLVEMGRRDGLRPVKAGTVHQVQGRVEIRRAGLTEWYENSARGLEQGFTIETRTEGHAPLVLELAVGRARAHLRGNAIELLTDAGRRLEYGKLLAEDSRGTVLASRLEVPSPDRVQLVIEDADAIYPLLIDPLLTGQPDARLESNQSDPEGHGTPEFGFSVSSAGDVNGDGFDDVIVGAPGWDGGQQGEGAAFVFLGSAGGIVGSDPSTAQAHLESNQPLAAFGVSVSGAGDVNRDGYDDVIVGANFYDSVLPGTQLGVTGAAFVFLGSPSGIQGRDPTTAHASVFANKHESEFGEIVAHAGDVNRDGFDDVIVCAPHQGHDFPPDSGIPPNQQSGEHGAVFVFHGSAQGIVSGTGITVADAVLLPYQLGPVDPVVLAQFSRVAGADVNGDGFDDVLVGGNDVFLFLGSATGIVGRDPTTARSQIRGDAQTNLVNVGSAGDVNADGFDDVLIGAPGRESVRFSQDEHGAAYVFLGGPGGIVGSQIADAHAAFFGSILAEWVGYSVDGAGDVDRDGFADIVLAARVYPGSLANEGVAYLFRGSAQGITARSLLDADARLEARQSGAVVKGTSAFSVAGAGDINHDGFADVIMGKGFFDAGQVDEGAAFIYLGGPFPGNPNQPPVAVAGADQSLFDTDGDGFHQVTVDGTGSFDVDGSIASFAWFEGEALLGTSAVLTTTLATTGDHTLVLVVTDDDGVSTGDPVTVRVDKVSDPLVFSETFASGFGAWQSGGDVALSSVDPFPTAPQVRFGAAGAFLRRSAALPAGSTGITVDVWIKASEFASGDEFRIKVSADGGPFTTIRTLTSADISDTYTFYGGSAIPLGHSWFPATASSVVLEFESRSTTGRTFIDDVKVRALVPPPAAWGNAPSLSSLALNPSSVTGGTSANGTVTLTAAAPTGGAVVSLSDNSAAASTPSTVMVPAGATSATFTATTTPVSITTLVTLTATVGSTSRTAGLTVTPAGGGGGGAPAFRSPTGNAPESGGDGNGFESNAANAYGDDTSVATDTNSGSGTSTSCTSTGKDRHRFYDYLFAIPGGSAIAGIEVRVDARADSTSGTPKMCVQLSWDGGTSWTASKATGTLGTSVATFTLGGATDTWGRTWSPANLSNASFRVRVINVASSTSRDFFLEWVAVRPHLTASTPTAVSALSLSPASVTGGMSSTGTVTLAEAALPGGAVVALASSNAVAASVPASVTVPAGATSVTFTATTTPVTTTTVVTLTATGSTTRTAALTVTNNKPPVAVAGPDQTLTDTDGDGLVVVAFDGTGSSDPDGTIVSHFWRKNGNPFNNVAAFSVLQPIGSHTIELTVTDDQGATSTDTVVINIVHPAPPPDNLPPVSNAGPDQTVTDTDGDGLASVLLNGAASFDPDGAISGYGWYEGGVQIASAFGVGVPLTVGVHTITLYVSDEHGASDTDTVVITVNAADAPPTTASLTVTATGRSGERVTSSPAGINVTVGSTGSASFAVDTRITLTASNGREAVWSGACSSGGNRRRTCTFTLNGNASVNANVR